MKTGQYLINTVLLLVTLLIVSFTKGDNDLAKKGLKGKVKSYGHYDYEIRYDSLVLRPVLIRKESVEYDKKGNWVNVEHKTNPNHKKDQEFKDIKEVNRLLDSIIKTLSGTKNPGTYKATDKYSKYDRKRNKIESIWANEYGIKYIDSFDKRGYLIKHYTVSPDNKVDERVLIYNAQKDVIKEITYNNDSIVIQSVHKYIYDRVGNWVVDSTFSNDTLSYIRKQQFEYW